MTDPRIALTVAQGIARLTIRRPEKQNALDAAMLDVLIDLAHEVHHTN